MSLLNPSEVLVLRAEETKLEAWCRSAWITFLALAGGFLMSAVANGAKTPVEVLAYAKANYLVWLTANIIAPAVRAARATGKDRVG